MDTLIEFAKEVGMALIWIILGYLVGKDSVRKDREDD